MIDLVWDDKFRRIFKKWSLQHPDLVPLFRERIELFVSDSFHPSLRVHSLSGILLGLWAMKINYDQRLINAAGDSIPDQSFTSSTNPF